MNRLLTFSGLQPIYLGDIDFLQDSVKESFVHLLRGLTGTDDPSCVLVNATAERDGVICLNGEIMPLKAFNGSGFGSIGYRIESTFSGRRQFKNGDEHDCHEIRHAQEYLTLGGSGVPDFMTLLMSRFKVVRQTSVFAADDTIAATRAVSYSRLGTCICLEVNVTFGAESTVTNIFTDAQLAVPSSIVGQGPKYTNLVAEVGGNLINIPAKVTFAANEGRPSDSFVTIKIPRTTFPEGSTGAINLMLVVN